MLLILTFSVWDGRNVITSAPGRTLAGRKLPARAGNAVCPSRGVLIAARIILLIIPLSGALTSRSLAPIDTVQQINRCLTAVRVAVSRRQGTEPRALTLRQQAVGVDPRR